MCSKPIFCSKIALKGKTCSRLLKPQKVAPNAKSCSKVAEHNRDRPKLDSLAAIFTHFAKRQMFIDIFGTVADCQAIRICRIATNRKQSQEPTQLTP